MPDSCGCGAQRNDVLGNIRAKWSSCSVREGRRFLILYIFCALCLSSLCLNLFDVFVLCLEFMFYFVRVSFCDCFISALPNKWIIL